MVTVAPANERNIFHSRHNKFAFGDKFLLVGNFARSVSTIFSIRFTGTTTMGTVRMKERNENKTELNNNILFVQTQRKMVCAFHAHIHTSLPPGYWLWNNNQRSRRDVLYNRLKILASRLKLCQNFY